MTELESLQNKLQTFQDWEDVELSLEEFTAQIELALNSTDVNLQRQIIRLLIERIVVHEETMVIEHLVPTNEPISKLQPQRQGAKTLRLKEAKKNLKRRRGRKSGFSQMKGIKLEKISEPFFKISVPSVSPW